MATEEKSVSGNILFKIFWWIALRLNPQWAHRLMYFGLRDGSFGRTTVREPALEVKVWGHTFNTPIGIAGGVDDQGNVLDRLIQIGYGFGSFGPYTLEKEMPDQRKYFFRKDRAILTQCLGIRNSGLLRMLPIFVKRRYLPHFVGVELAIPAESEEQNIKQGRHFTYQEEFVLMVQKVAPYCDFVTLDLSHPDSELSMLVVDSSTMIPMIKAVKNAVRIAAPIQTPPIVVKIPQGLDSKAVDLVVNNLMDSGADGIVVAGPLSMSKNSVLRLSDMDDEHVGMLTGAPVLEQTTNLIRQVYATSKGKLPIIGCGGVFTAEDAFALIKAGATMVQIDSAALTFAGPTCVSEIHKGLLALLKEKNFAKISHVVGFDLKSQTAGVPEQTQPQQPTTQTNVISSVGQASAQVVSTPAHPTESPVAQPNTVPPVEQPSAGSVTETVHVSDQPVAQPNVISPVEQPAINSASETLQESDQPVVQPNVISPVDPLSAHIASESSQLSEPAPEPKTDPGLSVESSVSQPTLETPVDSNNSVLPEKP